MICMYCSCRFIDDLVGYFFNFSFRCYTEDLLFQNNRSFDGVCVTACPRNLVFIKGKSESIHNEQHSG